MLTVMFVLVVTAVALYALHHRRENVIELDDTDILVGPPLPTYAMKGASSSAVRSRNI
ncbi:MAG: hypothetical protein QM831_32825 [Kofleriaceae bacterium]